MAQIELKMPKMGESVHEATIIRWLKNEGETIEADESLLEIATDKVDSEVPSTAAGVLAKRLFNDGDVVQVGTVIAMISTAGETAVAPASKNGQPVEANVAQQKPMVAETMVATPLKVVTSSESRFYSPLVRTIASIFQKSKKLSNLVVNNYCCKGGIIPI